VYAPSRFADSAMEVLPWPLRAAPTVTSRPRRSSRPPPRRPRPGRPGRGQRRRPHQGHRRRPPGWA